MSPDQIFLTVNGRRMSLAKLIENPAAATDVLVENCPGLTELPDLPAATYVWVENCPSLTELPDLPAATDVRVENCPGLTELPDLPAATYVWVENCPSLTELPDLPAATDVRVYNCAGLTAFYAGADSRKYQFYAVKIRGLWRVVAGCKNLSFEDARIHWGPGGASDRPDCLALVEKLAAAVETRAEKEAV